MTEYNNDKSSFKIPIFVSAPPPLLMVDTGKQIYKTYA